jgi:hypothetical protein
LGQEEAKMKKILVFFIMLLSLTAFASAGDMHDLSSTDDGNWISTSQLNSVDVAPTSCSPHTNVVFISGSGGTWGYYDIDTNQSFSLMDTDVGNFMGTVTLYAISGGFNGNAYVGGGSSMFGKYDCVTNITSDLRASDPGNWWGIGTVLTLVARSDPTGDAWIGGYTSRLGYYDNLITQTNIDMRGLDTADWIGLPPAINKVSLSTAFPGRFYLVGTMDVFGYYDGVQINDLTVLDSPDFLTAQSGVYQLKDVDTDTNGDGYFVGFSPGSAIFGYYDESASTTYQITLPGFLSAVNLRGIAVDDINQIVYMGGDGGVFALYYIGNGTFEDLSATDTNDWVGSSAIFDVDYRSIGGDNSVYLALAGGKIGVYKPNDSPPLPPSGNFTPIGHPVLNYSSGSYDTNLTLDASNVTGAVEWIFIENDIVVQNSTSNVYTTQWIADGQYNFIVQAFNGSDAGEVSDLYIYDFASPVVVDYTPIGHPVLNYPSGNYTTALNLTVSNVTGAESYVFIEDNAVVQNSSSDTYLWNPVFAGVYNVTVYGFNGTYQGETSDLYQYNYIIEIIPPAETPTQINYFGIFVFLIVLWLTMLLVKGKKIPSI